MAKPQRKTPVRKSGRTKAKTDRRPIWHYLLWYGFNIAFWLTFVAVIAGGIFAFSVDKDLTAKFEGKRWKLPSHVYSDSLTVLPGSLLSTTGLIDRLVRLNYQRVERAPDKPGEYYLTENTLELYLRGFDYPGETVEPRLLRLSLGGEMVTRIFDLTNRRELALLEIEPELIGRFFGQVQEERRIIPYDKIPKSLVWSVVVMEDDAFFRHHGLNFKGLFRAALKALVRFKAKEGGSSITQQLVKNFYLSPERTITRKLKEMVMAVVLEMHYPKEKIFEVYINEIYFGQSGSVAICGLGEAAQFYFGKKAEDLTLPEAALLAGVLRSPGVYDPRAHDERAKIRRDYILQRLAKTPRALAELQVTKEMLEQAKSQDLAVHKHLPPRNIAPYFLDLLRQQLARTYGEDVLQSEGLKIFTTLDVAVQRMAESAVTDTVAQLEKNNEKLRVKDDNKLQAAIVVIEPSTGYVRAMVGGRDYRSSPYNRAVQMQRQVGSIFKPIVYTSGFWRAYKDRGFKFSGATMLADEAFSINSGGKKWSPHNFDDKYEGMITARRALEGSRNVPTAKAALMIGIDNIIDTARAMGVQADLPPYPALSLGVAEMSPLEIAGAYTTLANQGYHSEPLTIRDVVDRQGNVLEKRSVKARRALPAEVVYQTTSLMRGVVERGTAGGLRRQGYKGPAAAKTGTTNDAKDAWFVGFTPEILAVTWVGFDRDRNVGLTGARAAMPIWAHFMIQYTHGQMQPDFEPPPGIVFRKICQESGMLSRYNCPKVVEEAFLEGAAPEEECDLHRDGLLEFFRKKGL